MANKTPHLLFKKTWVDFLKEEFSNDPEMTMQVFFAICDYAYGGVIPEDMAIRLAIGTIRKEIDLDRQAYEELSDKRRKVRLDAVSRKKNDVTIVDFVDESTTNGTNQTNATNGTNIIYNNISNSSLHSELQNKKKNKTKKEVEQIVLTDDEIQFNERMKEEYPRVMAMKKPMSLTEYDKLVSKFGEHLVEIKLSSLNNYTDIKKYVSAYDTINNWCKMAIDRNGGTIESKSNGKEKKSNASECDLASDVLSNIFG